MAPRLAPIVWHAATVPAEPFPEQWPRDEFGVLKCQRELPLQPAVHVSLSCASGHTSGGQLGSFHQVRGLPSQLSSDSGFFATWQPKTRGRRNGPSPTEYTDCSPLHRNIKTLCFILHCDRFFTGREGRPPKRSLPHPKQSTTDREPLAFRFLRPAPGSKAVTP